MVTFKGGPADTETLMLRRAPFFLRVVHNPNRKNPWDALDQLGDIPNARETIHVYVRTWKTTPVHFNMRPRSSGGFYARAEYSYYDAQPEHGEAKNTQAWRSWCRTHYKAVKGVL